MVTNAPLFASIDRQTLSLIVQHMKCVIFAPNDVIVKYNSHGMGMYFVNCGVAAVYTGDGVEVRLNSNFSGVDEERPGNLHPNQRAKERRKSMGR